MTYWSIIQGQLGYFVKKGVFVCSEVLVVAGI